MSFGVLWICSDRVYNVKEIWSTYESNYGPGSTTLLLTCYVDFSSLQAKLRTRRWLCVNQKCQWIELMKNNNSQEWVMDSLLGTDIIQTWELKDVFFPGKSLKIKHPNIIHCRSSVLTNRKTLTPPFVEWWYSYLKTIMSSESRWLAERDEMLLVMVTVSFQVTRQICFNLVYLADNWQWQHLALF